MGIIVLSLLGSFVAALLAGFLLSWFWLWVQVVIVVVALCVFAFMAWVEWEDGDFLDEGGLIMFWVLLLPAVFLMLPLSVPATAALASLVVPPYCWLSIRASRIEQRDSFLAKNAAYYKELQDYEKRFQRYQADLPIWKTSWLCTSCGKGWRCD